MNLNSILGGFGDGAVDKLIKTAGGMFAREAIYKAALEDIAEGELTANECSSRALRALKEGAKAG